MESQATTKQTELNNGTSPEPVKPKKQRNKKAANGENLTFPLMNSKRENIGYIHPDEIKNPLQFIGNLIKTTTQKVLFFVDFPRNHVVCTVPASGTYGEKERSLMAVKNYLEAMTNDLERDAQITDKKTLEVLGLFTAKGWKFKTFTKIGILEVAKQRVKEVTTAVNLVKQITLKCPELQKLVANNQLRSEIAKEIKEKGIEAGIKLAKEKNFKALPTINR